MNPIDLQEPVLLAVTDLDLKFDVRGFVAQASPIDPVMFHNAKAEGYFTLREWMKAGQIHGVEDEDTKAQLSDIRYRERQGRIEIESKQEARARGSSGNCCAAS